MNPDNPLRQRGIVAVSIDDLTADQVREYCDALSDHVADWLIDVVAACDLAAVPPQERSALYLAHVDDLERSYARLASFLAETPMIFAAVQRGVMDGLAPEWRR